MSKFNKLEVPYQWREYWTKYPHGFTIYEALIDWINKVNGMVTNVNDWNEYLDNFVDNFEFELQEEVKTTIEKWQSEGLLDEIIGSVLNTELDTIKSDMVDVESQLAETELKLEGKVSVKQFGAMGDGEADDSAAIQAAINSADNIYLPPGTYKITEPITVPGGKTIQGASPSKTIIIVHGDVNGFELTRTYRSKFSGFGLSCADGVSAGSSGFYFDGSEYVRECNFEDLRIVNFDKGFDIGNGWWMNTVRDVRWVTCNYSVYSSRSTAGTNINNLFSHCYSDRPLIGGFRLGAFKNTEIQNCNFGGRKGHGNQTTYAIMIEQACKSIYITGANIEHHIVPDRGVVQVWSTSKVKMEMSNFVNLTAAEGIEAFYINVRDRASLTLNDCVVYQPDNVRGIRVMNDATLFHYNNDSGLNDIVNQSTNPITTFDHVTKYTKGESTITSGGFIDTGLGVRPKFVQITVMGTEDNIPPVTAVVTERYSSGSIKVRFVKNSDGTQDYGTYTVSWLAFAQ